jgi:hypothetical protein
VIPAGGFLLGEAPIESNIPNYTVPKQVVVSYHEGIADFIAQERVPPFQAVALTRGLFTAAVVSGEREGLFGMRAELRRNGVYGTILIERLILNIATINLSIEGCPDITDETQETSTPVTLTSEEACPHITEATEETAMPISILTSDA